MFITPVVELTAILELLLVNVPVKALPVLLVGVIVVSGSKSVPYWNGIVPSKVLGVIFQPPVFSNSVTKVLTTLGDSVILLKPKSTVKPLFNAVL